MDYSNLKYVKRKIITSLIFILAIFLVSGAISHMLYQIHMILRWVTIIVIIVFACNAWGALVGYNSAMQYKGRIKHLEDDLNEFKKNKKNR